MNVKSEFAHGQGSATKTVLRIMRIQLCIDEGKPENVAESVYNLQEDVSINVIRQLRWYRGDEFKPLLKVLEGSKEFTLVVSLPKEALSAAHFPHAETDPSDDSRVLLDLRMMETLTLSG